ncbi:hypothetical protein CEXT_223901 [Caerostris extrusa]|uniref:Uncharacterized protein n=1 Tax=Caerostris extrusa TaxID=172846 RepID=A0AAV4MWE6_CAEEX|nr:hypothetical protein CEXT_223901 [Caerostris extrusa]
MHTRSFRGAQKVKRIRNGRGEECTPFPPRFLLFLSGGKSLLQSFFVLASRDINEIRVEVCYFFFHGGSSKLIKSPPHLVDYVKYLCEAMQMDCVLVCKEELHLVLTPPP